MNLLWLVVRVGEDIAVTLRWAASLSCNTTVGVCHTHTSHRNSSLFFSAAFVGVSFLLFPLSSSFLFPPLSSSFLEGPLVDFRHSTDNGKTWAEPRVNGSMESGKGDDNLFGETAANNYKVMYLTDV